MYLSIATLSSTRKPEVALGSSGTAADGGWQRWWATEARRNGTDWTSLIQAADLALSRLRAAHSSEAGS